MNNTVAHGTTRRPLKKAAKQEPRLLPIAKPPANELDPSTNSSSALVHAMRCVADARLAIRVLKDPGLNPDFLTPLAEILESNLNGVEAATEILVVRFFEARAAEERAQLIANDVNHSAAE